MGVVLFCAYSLSLVGRNTYFSIWLRRSQGYTWKKRYFEHGDIFFCCMPLAQTWFERNEFAWLSMEIIQRLDITKASSRQDGPWNKVPCLYEGITKKDICMLYVDFLSWITSKRHSASSRSTWRPFGSERLDMSSSTCLTAKGSRQVDRPQYLQHVFFH